MAVLVISVVLISSFAFVETASAATVVDYTPFSNAGEASPLGSTGGGIADIIKDIFAWSRNIAAILAVAMIAAGGVLYSVSAAVDKKAEAKGMIKDAILGLILLLGATVILGTINPQLIQLSILDYGQQTVAGALPCEPGENPKDHNCIATAQSLGGVAKSCNNIGSLPKSSVCNRISDFSDTGQTGASVAKIAYDEAQAFYDEAKKGCSGSCLNQKLQQYFADLGECTMGVSCAGHPRAQRQGFVNIYLKALKEKAEISQSLTFPFADCEGLIGCANVIRTTPLTGDPNASYTWQAIYPKNGDPDKDAVCVITAYDEWENGRFKETHWSSMEGASLCS